MQTKSYAELIVHIPLCTHKEPKDILIISDDAAPLCAEVAKYGSMECVSVASNIEALGELAASSFDVIISEAAIQADMLAQINRLLREDALASFAPLDLELQNKTSTQIRLVGEYFKIAMPYFLLDTTKNVALLASKEYHPTADINLQRADLTDGFVIYNSDLHTAAFAMPTYIKQAYLGIIKN